MKGYGTAEFLEEVQKLGKVEHVELVGNGAFVFLNITVGDSHLLKLKKALLERGISSAIALSVAAWQVDGDWVPCGFCWAP